MRRARHILLCMATTLGALTSLSAQPALTFEVASIRRQSPDAAPGPAAAGTSPGRNFTHGGSIRTLLPRAFGAYAQLIGGPDWIREDIYIIKALAPENVPPTPENLSVMVRALLEDRFKLVAHEETREIPVYVVLPARADRSLGPGLRPFPPDCETRRNAARQNGQPTPDDCGTNVGTQPDGWRGRNASMARLASILQIAVQRPVIDRSGITGTYNFDLKYAERAGSTDADQQLPSLFTALQEQLGLKLESQREPMKVLVVDSIERPTEN